MDDKSSLDLGITLSDHEVFSSFCALISSVLEMSFVKKALQHLLQIRQFLGVHMAESWTPTKLDGSPTPPC